MNLSARGFYRMLKVSRTIADMREAPNVEVVDISEALRYRTIN
jgi:magnesium chelatase family protein